MTLPRPPWQRSARRLVGRPARAALRLHARADAVLRRRLFIALEGLEPPVRVLHRRLPPSSAPLGLVCVYRERNWRRVTALLDGAPAGTRVALWALDSVAPALAEHTVGSGPGVRTALLNRLAAEVDLPADGWLVMTDDDVTLLRGTLADLLAIAVDLGMDVCQPAHSHRSNHFWKINQHHFLTWARATRFVETGPLLMFSPRARATCLPVPELFTMGIGSEAVWGGRAELRLGVIESLTMLHTGVIGAEYDSDSQWEASKEPVAELLRPVGLRELEELQTQEGRWWWGRRRPTWATRDRAA